MNLKTFARSLSPEEVSELYEILWSVRTENARRTVQDLTDDERCLVEDGRFIDAIKSYRLRLGSSLLEAKLAAEKYRDSL